MEAFLKLRYSCQERLELLGDEAAMGVWLKLMLMANFRTGVWQGTAPKLTKAIIPNPESADHQRIWRFLKKLRKFELVNWLPNENGKPGNYPFLLNKYEPQTGQYKGKRLNAFASQNGENAFSMVYEMVEEMVDSMAEPTVSGEVTGTSEASTDSSNLVRNMLPNMVGNMVPNMVASISGSEQSTSPPLRTLKNYKEEIGRLVGGPQAACLAGGASPRSAPDGLSEEDRAILTKPSAQAFKPEPTPQPVEPSPEAEEFLKTVSALLGEEVTQGPVSLAGTRLVPLGNALEVLFKESDDWWAKHIVKADYPLSFIVKSADKIIAKAAVVTRRNNRSKKVASSAPNSFAKFAKSAKPLGAQQ
jgi:hypothetical protein